MTSKNSISVSVEDVSLDIELEEVQFSYSFGEARPGRGAAALAALSAQQQIQSSTLDFAAVAAIQQVVLKYESLLPKDVKASYGVLTTAPYTSISNGASSIIDAPALDAWLASPSFAASVAANNGNQPHPLSLIRFDAVLIDQSTASAHYTLAEEIAPGNVQFATSAVVLINDIAGWKIAVHMQHPV